MFTADGLDGGDEAQVALKAFARKSSAGCSAWHVFRRHTSDIAGSGCSGGLIMMGVVHETTWRFDRALETGPRSGRLEGKNPAEEGIHTIGLVLALVSRQFVSGPANTTCLWDARRASWGLAVSGVAQMACIWCFPAHHDRDGQHQQRPGARTRILIVILVAAVRSGSWEPQRETCAEVRVMNLHLRH